MKKMRFATGRLQNVTLTMDLQIHATRLTSCWSSMTWKIQKIRKKMIDEQNKDWEELESCSKTWKPWKNLLGVPRLGRFASHLLSLAKLPKFFDCNSSAEVNSERQFYPFFEITFAQELSFVTSKQRVKPDEEN